MTAVEVILRTDDPLVANRRTTTREVMIGDRTIPEGENLTLVWVAASRDPHAFDDPEGIKLPRKSNEARQEVRVALEELLSRTRGFDLAGEARRSVYPSDGLAALPLRFR